LNRAWAFPRPRRGLAAQAARYAASSLAAYLALQGALWVLIEVLFAGPRAAWLPAKGFAWLAISYPLLRFAVFNQPRPRRAVG
jgi:hypothetical protein